MKHLRLNYELIDNDIFIRNYKFNSYTDYTVGIFVDKLNSTPDYLRLISHTLYYIIKYSRTV